MNNSTSTNNPSPSNDTPSPVTSPKSDPVTNDEPPTMLTETKKVTMCLGHQGTECWALFHGGFDHFPSTQINEKYDPNQIQVVLQTETDPCIVQSQKGYMSLGLGLSDYSKIIEQQKEKCHCGTFTVDGKTFLMLIQKKYLEHFINITYQTCQIAYHKKVTRFYLRINSKSDDQATSKDIITTETPEDTSRYVEIENFQQYLGTVSEEGTYKVRVYNHDETRCLAQATTY